MENGPVFVRKEGVPTRPSVGVAGFFDSLRKDRSDAVGLQGNLWGMLPSPTAPWTRLVSVPCDKMEFLGNWPFTVSCMGLVTVSCPYGAWNSCLEYE